MDVVMVAEKCECTHRTAHLVMVKIVTFMFCIFYQYFATWCQEPTRWKGPWACKKKLRAGGKGGNRGWDGWMASLTRWTWVWASSGSWWWTGEPGVLQSMGLQRVGHNLAYGTTTYPTTIKKILYGWRSWHKGGQRVEQGSLRGFRDKARRILSRLQFQALLLISQVTSCLPSCLPNSQTVTGSLYKTGEHCG